MFARLFKIRRLHKSARGGCVHEFVDLVSSSQFLLLGLPSQKGPNSEGVSEEDFLAYIGKQCAANFNPMTLTLDCGEALLIFTAEKTREQFASIMTKEAGCSMAYLTTEIPGTLLPELLKDLDTVVIDPMSDKQYTFTNEQIQLLRKHIG